ncbi:MAG TPA: hypothetical protein VFD74_08705 [Thermoleophilia bacterium]|nr:hypothetical protein [Thermoleophilia bacterium]
MDYSDLLRRAWRVAWRHKYLWLLGLVASEGGCGISGGAPNISYSFGSDQGYGPFASGSLDLADWIAHNWPFLLALIVGLFLLGIVLWVISIIATGGLIAGSDAANAEGPSGLGFAWSAGVRSFWRLLGMWLLVAVVALAIGLLFALAIGLPLGLALARGAHLGTGVIVALAVTALLLLLLAIPLAIVVQVVLTWSSRSLVLEGRGPVGSIRNGWRVFRANVGASFMTWLVSVGVSIAAGIALVLPLALLAVPLGLLVYRTATDGADGVMWGSIALVGLVALLVLAIFKAVFTSFSTAYWTIAYVNLASVSEPAASLQPAEPPLSEGTLPDPPL